MRRRQTGVHWGGPRGALDPEGGGPEGGLAEGGGPGGGAELALRITLRPTHPAQKIDHWMSTVRCTTRSNENHRFTRILFFSR